MTLAVGMRTRMTMNMILAKSLYQINQSVMIQTVTILQKGSNVKINFKAIVTLATKSHLITDPPKSTKAAKNQM